MHAATHWKSICEGLKNLLRYIHMYWETLLRPRPPRRPAGPGTVVGNIFIWEGLQGPDGVAGGCSGASVYLNRVLVG